MLFKILNISFQMLSQRVYTRNYERDNMEDIDYFNEVANSKEWSDTSKMNYKVAMEQYTDFCGLSFLELLDEAYKDEEDKTPHYRLRLRNRLNSWFSHLKDMGMSKNSIHLKKASIVALYKYAGIHIPELEKISGKSFNNNPSQQLQYEDIITREEIRQSLELADPTLQALILTSVTSGSAKKEVTNMTIKHFIEGTKDYHHLELPSDYTEREQHYFLKKVLKHLDPVQDEIVISFKLVRQKVQKNYYTFCTPECSKAIINMLKERISKRDLTNSKQSNRCHYITFDAKLFKINERYLADRLARINDILELGKAGRYRKLNVHMLRRYFATTLSNPIDGDLDTIMPSEYIDAFEGRSKNSMLSIYAKKNPTELKKVYMAYMYRLVIDVEKYNYKQIEKENKKLRLQAEKVDLLEDKLHEIEENYDLIITKNRKKWLV